MAMFDRVSRSPISALAAAVVITALTIGLPGTARAQETLTLGLPAIPPVFITVQAYVAQQQKLFEKHGVKVNLRPFKPGDRVLFRVSTKDDHLVVDAMEKAK